MIEASPYDRFSKHPDDDFIASVTNWTTPKTVHAEGLGIFLSTGIFDRVDWPLILEVFFSWWMLRSVLWVWG